MCAEYITEVLYMQEIIKEIGEQIKKGKAKIVKQLVAQALDEGINAQEILDDGLLAAMTETGVKFKNNEIFVPEVLVAARAMNAGIELLKPHLIAASDEEKGVAVIGTVKGDMHDIGKNLVKMMIEGRGIRVVDLGADVSAEQFADAAAENNADIVCCSALLTTTMPEMKRVVEVITDRGLRDRVKIMVGGAPVNQGFCDQIKADCYTEDAASAAEAALHFIRSK